jgi:hypothetical protein
MPVEDDEIITIWGDTESLDLMSDVNEILAEHGLVFEDVSVDGHDHLKFQLQQLHKEEDDE